MDNFLKIMSFLHVNVQVPAHLFIFNALKTGFLKESRLVKDKIKYKRMICHDSPVKFANKSTLTLLKLNKALSIFHLKNPFLMMF